LGLLEGCAFSFEFVSAVLILTDEIRKHIQNEKIVEVQNFNDTIMSKLRDWKKMRTAADKDLEIIPGSGMTVGQIGTIMTEGVEDAMPRNQQLLIDLRSQRRLPLGILGLVLLVLGVSLHMTAAYKNRVREASETRVIGQAESNSAPKETPAQSSTAGTVHPASDENSQPNPPLSSWPTENGAYLAASSETIPVFPKKLNGYRSEDGKDFWGTPFPVKGTMRVFSGERLGGNSKFPQHNERMFSRCFHDSMEDRRP
jgi:hypothetical protein